MTAMAINVFADVFDDIAVAIKAGDAKTVAQYFDTSVSLKTIDKSNVYSRNQAEIVLKDFFDKNAPKNFTIIHRGASTKGAYYAIGSLETSKGSFRTYLYIKEVGGKKFIQEFSIEQE